MSQPLGRILNSHTVATLRKEVAKARRNIGGISKMKKKQLINHMVRTPSLYSHMKMRRKRPYNPRPPAGPPPVRVKPIPRPPRKPRIPKRPTSSQLASVGLGLRRGRGLSGGMTHTASRKLGAVLRRALNRKR